MNQNFAKAALFTGATLAIQTNQADAKSPMGDGSPVPVSPPADGFESPSAKKKKSKKKRRTSRSASSASAGLAENGEEKVNDETQDAVAVAPNAEVPVKEETLLHLPSSVASPSANTAVFDVFAGDDGSSVVMPSSSPVADAASAPGVASASYSLASSSTTPTIDSTPVPEPVVESVVELIQTETTVSTTSDSAMVVEEVVVASIQIEDAVGNEPVQVKEVYMSVDVPATPVTTVEQATVDEVKVDEPAVPVTTVEKTANDQVKVAEPVTTVEKTTIDQVKVVVPAVSATSVVKTTIDEMKVDEPAVPVTTVEETSVIDEVQMDVKAKEVASLELSELDSSLASAQAVLDIQFASQESPIAVATSELLFARAATEAVSDVSITPAKAVVERGFHASEVRYEAEETLAFESESTKDVVAGTEKVDHVSKSLSAAFEDVSDDEEADVTPEELQDTEPTVETEGHMTSQSLALLPSPPDEVPVSPSAIAESVRPPPAPATKKEIAKPAVSKSPVSTQSHSKVRASARTSSGTGVAGSTGSKTAAAKPPSLSRASSGSTTTQSAKTPPKPTISTAPSVASASTAASRARAAAVPPPSPAKSAEPDPRVVKKKLSASEVDAAGNRLYEQAMESKRKLEAKKAEVESTFTFTPQVNQTKVKKQATSDGMSRFELLHEKAKEGQRKKEEMRQQLEKELTFKPQITNKAKKIAGSTDRPRYENLYKNAQEIQAKREEKKKLVAEKDQEELTFKPKIKTTKSPVRSKPLYDPELVNKKRAQLEQKKLQAEAQSKPKPVKKTKLANGDNSFFDRLAQSAKQRAERLAKLKDEREKAEFANATFKPKVSEAAANVKTSAEPFHRRLYDKDHLKKVAAEREQRKLNEEKLTLTFKPRVSDIPDGVKSRGSNNSGSAGKSSIFERLYQDKDRIKEKIELSEELKIQKEMEECTFRPQVEIPPAVAVKSESTTPIWERLLSIDKNQIAEERERLKSMKELEACTFRPEISPTPGSHSPKRTSSSNIYERLSISAENTPVDEKKRRPSERKSVLDKQSSFNEREASPRPPSKPLSVASILNSAKVETTPEGTSPSNGSTGGLAFRTGGSTTAGVSEKSVAQALENGLAEDQLADASTSILENYDTWAAGLEEKLRNV